MKTLTKGGKTAPASIAHLNTLGTDGRIYGNIEGQMTHTWWNKEGKHNLYRDCDLYPEAARQFVERETCPTTATP